MEQEQSEMVRKIEVSVFGSMFEIEIFTRSNGKSFALTRYNTEDIIITDGRNPEDAFMRHTEALPLAIDCRIGKDTSAGNEITH